LQKDEDPVIINEWVPTGPIVSCNGCGKTFSDKTGGKGGSERVGAAVRKIYFNKYLIHF
jgi:transposase-like protein